MGARTLTAVGNLAADRIADAVLATVSPIHPPTVSTSEELDALPIGSVVAWIDPDNPALPAISWRDAGGWRSPIDIQDTYRSNMVIQPLRVLYTPQDTE
jgi:hypothetical protein